MTRKRGERQKKKYLGQRTFGRGNIKNRRGSGNRGGRGKAGRCKHKNSWAVKYSPGYFGKHGFSRPNAKKDTATINLYQIDRMVLLGKLDKSGEGYSFEFDGKILATGRITFPVKIKAKSWSRRTAEKLESAGGSISSG
jgi:large subunit ribosomal protein L15